MNHSNLGLSGSNGYEIRTQGHIADRWSEWFDGMTLVDDVDGTTIIQCPDLDQAALHGLLAKIRDLGLPLISVIPTSAPDGTTHRSSQR